MKPSSLLRLVLLTALLYSASGASAMDFVSVSESTAILYDAPSAKAKKKYVVNRFMPFEKIVVLDNWVKVRDSKGELSWIEKRALSSKRYVFALAPVADVFAKPDSGSPKVFSVRQQVAMEYLESTHTGWIKVRHQDGDTGFVRSTDVWGD